MPVISVVDSGDLKRLTKALGKVADGKELKRELSSGLRSELKPVVSAVKAAYGGGRHLRPALARATRAEVRSTGRLAGARVRVDGRRMFPRGGSLPAMYEGRKPWRHPVFGNRGNWLSQQPRPTFDRVVQPFEAPIRAKVEQIVAQVLSKAGFR